jgi:hypothetical protein
MQSISRPSGVAVTAPDGWIIRDAGGLRWRTTRGIRGRVFGPVAMPAEARSLEAGDMVAALAGDELSVVDQIELHAEPASRAGTRSSPPSTRTAMAVLALDLAPGEDAVVLLEQDGLYSWHFATRSEDAPPSRGRGIASAAARRRVGFDLSFNATPPAGVPRRRGLIADFVIGKARAIILKFVARVAVDQVTHLLERSVRRGLVVMNSDDPAAWPCVEDASRLELPEDRPARLLLFVHGTFSSTMGSFGSLAVTPWGREFLAAARANYDAVIGFDHATLGDDPLLNARDLLRRLEARSWPHRPIFDAISYSRGGIVLRSLLENLLPSSPWLSQVERAVFVGAVNAGTLLAKPDNWHTLIDVYTNLAAGACRAVALFPQATIAATLLRELLQSVGAFARHLATHAVAEGGIPGLAAMDPGGDFIRQLNSTQPGQPTPEDSQYFAVTSQFSPALIPSDARDIPRQLILALSSGLVDQLMGEGNDLVVNTASMTSIDSQAGDFIKDHLGFGANGVVYHTNYFLQPQTTAALTRWLKLPELPTAESGRVRSIRTVGGAANSPPHALSMDELVALAQRFPEAGPGDEPAASRRGIPVFAVPGGSAGDLMDELSKLPLPLPNAPCPPEPAASAAGAVKPEPKISPMVTCHFHAEMDEEVELNRTATIEVTFSREEIQRVVHAGSAGGRGEVDPSRQLIVQLLAKVNFQCVGETRVEMAPPVAGQPQSLYFDVMPTCVGEGEIWVVIRQGQVPLVYLILKPRVVTGRPASGLRMTAPASVAEAPALAEPLHQLSIFERRNGSEVFYQFILDSPTLGLKSSYESKPLKGDRSEYVQHLYTEIENRWVSCHADVAAFQEELRAFGAQLWDELIPRELQRELWDHRDRIRSVMIFSEEPFIPWELLHLKAPGHALGAEPLFLAQLGVVRWLHNLGWPPDRLALRGGRCRYVIPKYPHPDYRLPEAEQEMAFLEREFAATAVEAQPNSVRCLLSEAGAFDLLHFAGHGVAEQRNIANAQLLLEGRVEHGNYLPAYLSATTVEQFANLMGGDGRRPAVVLNACQAGRAGYKLCGIGGFARAFLSRGAGLFLGCLWAAGDRPARRFTETFYERLLAGQTVAESAIAAREVARAAGEATWLAYVVYGHPHARRERTF